VSERLPAVNAALNGLAAVLLVGAYAAIRNRRVRLHQGLMLAAFCTSVLFLACYLYYHLVVRGGQATKFTTYGWPRVVYFTVLLTHTVLAMVVAVLAPVTLYLGFGAMRGNRHRRVARWTLPIWLYVSVTGVVVYVMLYHLYPPA
jgi:putative membrane protein